MQLMGTKHYPIRLFSNGMDEKTLKMTPGVAGLQCRNDNNVQKISQLLLQNRHLSLRMVAYEVNIGKDTVRKIVVEYLRKQKICPRFVPHSLTPQQKDQRIADGQDLIATAVSDPDFFKKIVTDDETWYFAYDLTTKCQSAAWIRETSPRLKKL